MSLMYFDWEPHDDSDDEGPAQGQTSAPARGEPQDVRVRQMIDWYFEVLAFLDSAGADFTPSSKATGRGQLPRSGVYSIIEALFWGDKHYHKSELYGSWLERNFFTFIPATLRKNHQLRNPFKDETSSDGDVNWWKVTGLWANALESYGNDLYEGLNRPGGRRAFQTQNDHLIKEFQELLIRPPKSKTSPLWDATAVNLLDRHREEAGLYHVSMAYEDVILPWRPPRSLFSPLQLGTVHDLERMLTRKAEADEAARRNVKGVN